MLKRKYEDWEEIYEIAIPYFFRIQNWKMENVNLEELFGRLFMKVQEIWEMAALCLAKNSLSEHNQQIKILSLDVTRNE